MTRHLLHVMLAALLASVNYSAFAQGEPIVIEAESGDVGTGFEVTDEGDVTYITAKEDLLGRGNNPGGERAAAYTVTFAAPGNYDLYVRFRVGPESDNDDSFFIGLGFGEKDTANADDWRVVNNIHGIGVSGADQYVTDAGNAQTDVWKWLNISEFADTVFEVSEAGDYIFEIGARENGLDIDKLAFAPADLYYTVSNLENGEPGVDELPDPDATPPIAEGQEKFIGNIYSNSQKANFEFFWNQVTPENAGKWGSVEGTRDQMNWAQLDSAYNLAKRNDFPFRLHVLVWGAQQPLWMDDLDSAEQREEILEWFDAVSTRYPDIEMVEVVNEPLHQIPLKGGNNNDDDTGDYIKALGGQGETGWDWVIESFDLARQYFPDAELMINDYGIVNSLTNIRRYSDLVNLLKDRGLIDAVGVQSHAFNANNISADALKQNLDSLYERTGLPIYVTELDLDGSTDLVQIQRYQRVFKTYWEHEAVKGITLWGYRPGLWRNDERAYIITSTERQRPALLWMRAYVEGTFEPATSVSASAPFDTVGIEATLQLSAEVGPETATIHDVDWTWKAASGSDGEVTIDENGVLTGVQPGVVIVTATATGVDIGAETVSDQIEIEVVGGVTNVSDNPLQQISLYPNPVVQNQFTLRGIQKVKQINALDLTGKPVKTWRTEGENILTLDFSVAPGIYIIQLHDGQSSVYKKVMVK